jgi:hypothetical protein
MKKNRVLKIMKFSKKPINVVRLHMLLKGQHRDTFTFVRIPLGAEKCNTILTSLFPTNFTVYFTAHTSFGCKPKPSTGSHKC